MTAHSNSQWKWTDPLDDFPYEEVVSAIKANLKQTRVGYGIFSTADAVIFNTGVLLQRNRTTREDVEKSIPNDFPHRDKEVSITLKLLEMIETSKEKDSA